MKKRNFPIWTIIYRNLLFLIIITIIAGSCFYLYSRKKKNPTYTASMQVIVSATIDISAQKTSSTANNNMTLADMVLPTVISSFTSEEAISVINKRLQDSGIEDSISAGSIGTDINDTLIFTMSYTDSSKQSASNRLTYSIEGFGWWFEECEAMGNDIISTGSVSIMPLQKMPEVSKFTPYLQDAMGGAAIGLLVAFVVVVLRYIFDNKIRSEEELKEITGQNVIAFLGNKI